MERSNMARVVVIGANKGIGLELARQLSARGDEVVAVCRNTSSELEELDVEVRTSIDVGYDACAGPLQHALGDREVDLLIHNAGMLTRETLDDLDLGRIRKQFEVNTLGPIRTVTALLGNLKSGSKVAIVSSRVGSMGDNARGGNYGYRMSKSAVNMAGVNLSIDLKPRGIAVFLLHPGYVRTDLTGGGGETTPVMSAEGLIAQIDRLGLDDTGTFWHANGQQLPW